MYSASETRSHRVRYFSRFGTFVLQHLNNFSLHSAGKDVWQIVELSRAYLSGIKKAVKTIASAVSQIWIEYGMRSREIGRWKIRVISRRVQYKMLTGAMLWRNRMQIRMNKYSAADIPIMAILNTVPAVQYVYNGNFDSREKSGNFESGIYIIINDKLAGTGTFFPT